jgi:hypothetical protein
MKRGLKALIASCEAKVKNELGAWEDRWNEAKRDRRAQVVVRRLAELDEPGGGIN